MRNTRKLRSVVRPCASIIEQLEKRALLSAVLGGDGTLTVTGTSAGDKISVNFETDFAKGASTGSFSVAVNGDDSIFDAANVKQLVVNSLNGNDNIGIAGLEDNDSGATANPVNVVINSGDGNDTIYSDLQESGFANSGGGGGPSSSVTVGNGNDNVEVAGSTNATVVAGNGNDTLDASAGSDALTAIFYGGNGNDQVDGLSAGNASLVIATRMGTGHDTYYNGNDPDIHISGFTSDGQATGTTPGNVTITGQVQIVSPTNSYPAVGETVFIDTNNNGVLDSGETSTTTDAKGNYEFDLAVSDNDDPITYSVRLLAPGYTVAPPVRSVTASAGEGFSADDFTLAPVPTAVSPVLFGTSGSYRNQGNTIVNTVDGNLSSFFDSPTASGGFAALDYGSSQTISQISYAPRPGWTTRMIGGLFQGSNSADFSDAVTLYKITAAPTAGVLTRVNVNNAGTYRYVRYIGPTNSYCNIAEMKFTLSGKLTGAVIGTPGSYRNHGTTIANVFDGNLNTFFDAPDATGDWVGLDFGSATVVNTVSFAPRAGWESRMIGGQIQASNSANFSSGVVTLATLTTAPVAGQLTTLSLINTVAYRYYRYLGPTDSYCNIAELVFIG